MHNNRPTLPKRNPDGASTAQGDMKPAPFAYFAPESLDEALALLADEGQDAKLLAGGQSLIPALNFRLLQPAALIDLNRVETLSYIAATPSGGVRIGAMTRQAALERNPLVAVRAPLLAEAVPQIAHPQIRNRGTLGGSLVHADPAAELPVVMVALDAVMEVSGPAGTRRVPARDFFQGFFTVDVAPDEILTAVELPQWPERTGWAFVELARRHGDYALAGVAAIVQLEESGRCRFARLVYLNVGEGPVVAEKAGASLVGVLPAEAAFREAAALAASAEVDPSGHVHATADYQRHLVEVLTRRALARAASRAGATVSGLAGGVLS